MPPLTAKEKLQIIKTHIKQHPRNNRHCSAAATGPSAGSICSTFFSRQLSCRDVLLQLPTCCQQSMFLHEPIFKTGPYRPCSPGTLASPCACLHATASFEWAVRCWCSGPTAHTPSRVPTQSLHDCKGCLCAYLRLPCLRGCRRKLLARRFATSSFVTVPSHSLPACGL